MAKSKRGKDAKITNVRDDVALSGHTNVPTQDETRASMQDTESSKADLNARDLFGEDVMIVDISEITLMYVEPKDMGGIMFAEDAALHIVSESNFIRRYMKEWHDQFDSVQGIANAIQEGSFYHIWLWYGTRYCNVVDTALPEHQFAGFSLDCDQEDIDNVLVKGIVKIHDMSPVMAMQAIKIVICNNSITYNFLIQGLFAHLNSAPVFSTLINFVGARNVRLKEEEHTKNAALIRVELGIVCTNAEINKLQNDEWNFIMNVQKGHEALDRMFRYYLVRAKWDWDTLVEYVELFYTHKLFVSRPGSIIPIRMNRTHLGRKQRMDKIWNNLEFTEFIHLLDQSSHRNWVYLETARFIQHHTLTYKQYIVLMLHARALPFRPVTINDIAPLYMRNIFTDRNDKVFPVVKMWFDNHPETIPEEDPIILEDVENARAFVGYYRSFRKVGILQELAAIMVAIDVSEELQVIGNEDFTYKEYRAIMYLLPNDDIRREYAYEFLDEQIDDDEYFNIKFSEFENLWYSEISDSNNDYRMPRLNDMIAVVDRFSKTSNITKDAITVSSESVEDEIAAPIQEVPQQFFTRIEMSGGLKNRSLQLYYYNASPEERQRLRQIIAGEKRVKGITKVLNATDTIVAVSQSMFEALSRIMLTAIPPNQNLWQEVEQYAKKQRKERVRMWTRIRRAADSFQQMYLVDSLFMFHPTLASLTHKEYLDAILREARGARL